MTDANAAAPSPVTSNSADRDRRPMAGRFRGGGQSLLAQGETPVWITGAGLILCLGMIIGLLLYILYQGLTTLWPAAIVQIQTVDGAVLLGQRTRVETFALRYDQLDAYPPQSRKAAIKLLNRAWTDQLRKQQAGGLQSRIAASTPAAADMIRDSVLKCDAMNGLDDGTTQQLLDRIDSVIKRRQTTWQHQLFTTLKTQLADGRDGSAIWEAWNRARNEGRRFLEQSDVDQLESSLENEEGAWRSLWLDGLLADLASSVSVESQRQLLRTGNFDLTNQHFDWISRFSIQDHPIQTPQWAMVVERMEWGRFYGFPRELTIDGKVVASDPEEIWRRFQEVHAEVRDRWRRRRRLEQVDTGVVHREQEDARLQLRQLELDYGTQSEQWQTAKQEYDRNTVRWEGEFQRIRTKIDLLNRHNDRYHLAMATAQDQTKDIPLAEIVRLVPPNHLSWSQRIGVYLDRWQEFLLDEPRFANSEGGVFPAIFGTVVITILLSIAVVPIGILAALYLREYAKAGVVVSTVRIAVNNLAGVPSIVFGVFGVGFFCYIVGCRIDKLLFAAKLPTATFGTGGILWASLTLALLTLPVVIVATEEALAAVPRSMREGSLACGATKWQTIRRIVLPRAMPGIMTGVILAMARGAGEVAPLMLVGAMKWVPKLPIDSVFPYIHLERSFMHLGFHIYDLGFQSQNSEGAKPMVFTTTLLLIAIIGLMNVLAIWLRARLRRRFAHSQL